MKVHWLIDADMFDAYRDELVAAIRGQQQEVKLIRPPSPPYRWDDAGCGYRETFPADACVVALGDIELVTRIHREQLWRPGVFATVDHFACSRYYCHLGEHLLNQRYIMLPFGELPRCQEFLFDTLGHNGQIFVRPDSPLKLFTGQCMAADSFGADWEFMGFYEFPRESLVVVSPPRTIEAEWRFIIADQKVAAGCQYKRDGKNEVRSEIDRESHELAARIASAGYEPDPVWVMDICRTEDGSYYSLEIGGFSFADLYACDKSEVVSAVSAAALREWEKSKI